MYGKLIDGNLRVAPKVLTGEGTIVYNPPAEMYLQAGYKPVTFTPEPGDAPTGYVYVPGWEETDEAIIQTWTLEEEPDIDEAEAFDIIFGGAE